jgi:CheY-like chemotaxis protein
MDTLGQIIDRRPALPADDLCEAALAAFVRDETCRVLAVVEADRPVGLVQREAFLARMEVVGAPDRPLREVMDLDPIVADEDEDIGQFVVRAAADRPGALHGGFVVTRGGAYVGRLTGGGGGQGVVDRICAEVRQPIADALAASEGLRRLRLPPGAAMHVDAIAEAGRSALSLLDLAVDLRDAEAGRMAVTPEPRRLQELMDSLDNRWRVQAENAGVTLLVSYDGQPDCAAMVDGARLLQVFDALIGHALFHAGRGVIEASLKARPSDAGVTLVGRVRDNSATYAPRYLAEMFDGLASAPPVGLAIALGLRLAHHAVSAMSGRLEAAANIGPGATMAFEFTTAHAEAAQADNGEASEDLPSRHAHVLVVDDNATNRMVVEALCEMFHCSTESVVDGVEAVEAARTGRFDVILMDIKMPRMDGVAATREIRKLSGPAGRVPVIALTANADPDEVRGYLAVGMCSVVEKPIKPERLMEALDGALSGGPIADAAAE